MHMADALVAPAVAGTMYVCSAAAAAYSVKKVKLENDPKKIWESNIFGKSLHELVNEGLQTKLMKMPEDAQEKLQETLERIINEGSGGLICIIL